MATRVPPEKPVFPGYGTPFVSLYDRDMNLILDKITLADGSTKDIALSDFSYTFNETEDDMGTITITSNSVNFLDAVQLRHRNVLYIQWGYLNGDKRPKLKVLIRNFKERYDTNGYALTLTLSDNYAPAKGSKSPIRAKLEEVSAALSASLKDPEAQDKIEAFLNPIPEFKGFRRTWQMSEQDRVTRDFVEIEYAERDTAGRGDYSNQAELRFPMNDNPEIPWTPEPLSEALDKAPKPRTHNFLEESTMRLFESLGYAPGQIPDNYDQEAGHFKNTDNKGPTPEVTGTNTGNLVQELVDKTSDEPTVVSGSDGEVKIFKRRRVSLFPPITEYTFKGGDGRLLEFNYDSDASYDDDESVLRTLSIDPETGAVQVTDYANSVRKLEDAFNPLQYEQAKFETRAYEAALEQALQGNLTNANPDQPVGEVVGKPMLIQWGTHNNAAGGINTARDNTAMVTQFRALPISHIDEAKDLIENEIKNLKAEDTFRVRATAKTLGDPSISNGVNILIKGLSQARQGTYHITSCTHSISSAGYTNSYEMYKVSDIPANVDVIKSGNTNEEVNKEISSKKDRLLENAKLQATLAEQGYISINQLRNSDYYIEMNKLDKDWVTKVGYTDYTITYREKDKDPNSGITYYKSIVVRVPHDPRSPTTRVNLDSVFHFDDLYRLVGVGAMNAEVTNIKIINKGK